jgi:hypothetical protein
LNPPVLTVSTGEKWLLGSYQSTEAIETVTCGQSQDPEQDALTGLSFGYDGAATVVVVAVHAFFHALAAAPLF